MTGIVILYSGVAISPFLRSIINLRIQSTIIANTLLDFKVDPPNNGKDKKAGGWIQLELISLASAILPDDLAKSPLASLFSRSKMINIVPMSPSEQFLAAWFSELRSGDVKTAPESVHELFRTLSNYNSIPIEVYPLTFEQKNYITIRYRDQEGPPRAYQNFGILNFEKPVQIEAEDLKSAIKLEKDFSLEGFNPKESIISVEIEKILRAADAIILTAYDFPSLVAMLSYKDVRKSINKTNGTVIAISPIGSRIPIHSPREEPILQMFGVKPDIHGFLEIMRDIADIIVIDEEDSDLSSNAQEAGFNVVVGDLTKTKEDDEIVGLIVKAAGLDINSFKVDADVNKLNGSQKDFSDFPESIVASLPDSMSNENGRDDDGNIETHIEEKNQMDNKKGKIDRIAKEKLAENPDWTDTAKIASIVDSLSEFSMQSTFNPIVSTSTKLKKKNNSTNLREEEKVYNTVLGSKLSSETNEPSHLNDAKLVEQILSNTTSGTEKQDVDSAIELEESELDKSEERTLSSREIINNAVTRIKEIDKIDLDLWFEKVQQTIKQDESYELQVGNALLQIISSSLPDKIRNRAQKAFMRLSEDHTISFRSVLQSWLVNELNNPDFGVQEHQVTIIRRMSIINEIFIGGLLESFSQQMLSSEFSAAKRERGRAIVLRISLRTKKLSKTVIKSYLNLFSDSNVNRDNIWLALSGFEAQLVAIELMKDYSIKNCVKISKEGIQNKLGSFSELLNEIISAWADGDIKGVISHVGTLSDIIVRKAHRLRLADSIKKIGTIPLETLARSLKEDAKDLEALVYEMVMNDEISARLEIIDGRLYIIQINGENSY